jgi:hypothetical protein
MPKIAVSNAGWPIVLAEAAVDVVTDVLMNVSAFVLGVAFIEVSDREPPAELASTIVGLTSPPASAPAFPPFSPIRAPAGRTRPFPSVARLQPCEAININAVVRNTTNVWIGWIVERAYVVIPDPFHP